MKESTKKGLYPKNYKTVQHNPRKWTDTSFLNEQTLQIGSVTN